MRFTFSPSLKTVIVTLIVLGVIVLALGGYLTPLSRVALNPLVAVQTWISTRFQAIQDSLKSPSDVTRLRAENARLEAEVARLQAQVIELQQQVSEVQVLSTLLGFMRAHPDNKYVTAEVIGLDISPFLRYVIINRGSDDGLRRGMPVVTSQGLVGRVASVLPNAARIQLITDAGSYINVRLQKSGTDASLIGSVTGDLSLQSIPQNSPVEIGDVIITSGLGGDYPPNLIVGQVSSIRRRPSELFQTASVQPVVDFSQLKILLVITNFRPVDISPLIPTPGAP
jgi:rod shape-determining protein MreC